MRKYKVNSQKLINFIVIILVIVIFVILILMLNTIKKYSNIKRNNAKENTNINIYTDKQISEDINDNELERLKQLGERDRIEYYVSQFIELLENEEYDVAYSLLNSEFKNNYFPNERELRDYAQKNFSKMMNIEYTNFERNGKIYVVWLVMNDAINGGKNDGHQMNFVVKENNFNDFELSFSAN